MRRKKLTPVRGFGGYLADMPFRVYDDVKASRTLHSHEHTRGNGGSRGGALVARAPPRFPKKTNVLAKKIQKFTNEIKNLNNRQRSVVP